MLGIVSLLVITSPALAGEATTKPNAIVLVVGRGDAFDSRAGDGVRALLRADASCPYTVLDDDATAERLRGGFIAPPPARGAEFAAQLKSAAKLFDEFKIDGAVSGYDNVIASLQQEPELSETERKVLQTARIGLAVALMSAASPNETGRGESTAGQKAKAALSDAIRADPTLSLDVSRYPPRVRKVFETARVDTQAAGLGGLHVVSNPAGVTVMIEGRPLGQTPLKLLEALPQGRYRLWLEHRGRRTPARFIHVTAGQPQRVDIDADLDITLWAKGRGVWAVGNQDVTPAFARRILERANVEALILAGDFTSAATHQRYIGIVDKQAVRSGGFEIDRDTSKRVAAFINKSGDADRAPPLFFLPQPTTASAQISGATGDPPTADGAESEDDGESLPLGMFAGIGGAAAAGVVIVALLATASVAAFLWLTREPTGGAFDVAFVE